MKQEKIIRYLVYAFVLFGFLLLSQHVVKEFRRIASITYNTYPYIYVSIISSILIGVLIGLEMLLREARKRGTWKIHAEKLLFLGLPSFYFTFNSLISLPFFPHQVSLPSLPYINPETTPIAAIILGYTIGTSFYKKIN